MLPPAWQLLPLPFDKVWGPRELIGELPRKMGLRYHHQLPDTDIPGVGRMLEMAVYFLKSLEFRIWI